MTRSTPKTTERERRLDNALAEYLEAEEAGQPPDRQQLFVRHPDLASELKEFFANRSRLASLADPMQTVQLPSGKVDTVAPVDAAELAAAEPAASVGRLGDYELIGEIARGGMGVVYRARQLSASREVALKMILSGPEASSNALQRFRAEAEAAAKLDHPNIVPIYDVGAVNGQPYFTMKLLEGGSLASRLEEFSLQGQCAGKGARLPRRERQMRQRRIAALMAAVARAVHHAHQHGVLHRDLKPGNILLTTGDECSPMITDFGLAKRTDVDLHVTQSQTIIGTAAYMAPEQAVPSRQGLTTTADVYSLGSILYELLTGRPPFVAASFFDTLVLVVKEAPVPPSERNQDVAADLEKICLKCLHKGPEHRYSSALELAQDLDHWRTGEAISLRKAGPLEQISRWARRNLLAAALLAAVAVLLIGATVGSLIAAWHIAAARDAANRNFQLADQNAEEAARARDSAVAANTELAKALAEREKALAANQRLLVAGYAANGTRALDGGDPFSALVWFGEALNRDRGGPEREDAHRVRLAGALHRCPRLVQVWFDCDGPPDFSPDGRRVLLIRKNVARVFDVSTGEAVTPQFRHADPVVSAKFSQDGSRVVTVTERGAAQLWDPSQRPPLAIPLKHGDDVRFAAFNREGSRVVTVGKDQAARVWRTSDGGLAQGPFKQNLPMHFASFGPDGKHLVTCGGDPPGGDSVRHGEVHVWDLTGRRTVRADEFKPGVVVHKAFLTADGKQVAGLGGVRVARLWDLATGREIGSVGGVRMNGEGSISADGGRALKLEGTSARVYDLATGQPVAPPMQHVQEAYYASFSPDAGLVVTAGRERAVRVWDAATGQALTPSLRHPRLLTGAWFSADNRLLMMMTDDGAIRIWDWKPRELAQLLALPAGPSLLALSPGGGRLAMVEKDGAVRVRDALTQRPVAGPWNLPGTVLHLVFAPDDRTVLAVSETSARVWDSTTGEAVTPVLTHAGGPQQAFFTPDGSRAVIKGGKELVQIWNIVTSKLQSSQPMPAQPRWRGLVLSPDGSAALAGRAVNVVEVCDPASGESLNGPFRHAAAVVQAAFSPDGKLLAVATVDGSAYLWDLTTGKPATPPMQHGAPLRLITFSGDGRRLATIAEDQSARVWDVATGLPVSGLLPYGEPVAQASLSFDGRRLVTRGKGNQGCIWNLAPDPRPVDDLLGLTHLLSGQALDSASGGFEPAGVTNLRDAWPKMRARYPQEFRPSNQ